MTNKLREVIETNRKKTSALCLMLTDDSATSYDLVRHSEECQTRLLDAIIEEREEYLLRKKSHLEEMKKQNYTKEEYNEDLLLAADVVFYINQLKQARDELSTNN